MHATLKKLLLGFFLAALSVLFWLFVKHILFQPAGQVQEHFWSYRNIGIFASLLTFYGIALGLCTYLVSDRRWAYGMVLAGTLPFFLASQTVGFEALEAYALLLAAFIVMRERVAKENAARITLSVDSAVPKGLGFALTAIAVAVSVVFFVSPGVEQLQDIRIPREFFQKLISPIELAFQQRAKLDVFELKPNEKGSLAPAAPSPVTSLKPEEQSALQNILRPFTEKSTATGPYSEFSDAVYTAVNNRIASIASLAPHIKRIVALSLSLALFTTIRLLAIPVGWVVIVLTAVLVNVLTYVGFVKVGTVQVDKEVIEL